MTSSLETILEEIRTNDPTRTCISSVDYGCNVGYGARMGAALLNSPFVSEVVLLLNDLASSHTHEQMSLHEDLSLDMGESLVSADLAPLLEYLQGRGMEPTALQRITLVPGHIRSPRSVYETAINGLVLEAVSHNPNRLWLSCRAYIPNRPFVHLLRETRTLYHLDIDLHYLGCTSDMGSMDDVNDAITQAFASNTSLETLTLHSVGTVAMFPSLMSVSNAVLAGLHNHSTLKTLELSLNGERLPTGLPRLLQSNKFRLQTLKLERAKIDETCWLTLGAGLFNRVPSVALVDCPLDETASAAMAALLQQSRCPNKESPTGAAADTCSMHTTDVSLSYDNRKRVNELLLPSTLPNLFSIPCGGPVRVGTLEFRALVLTQVQVIASFLPETVYMTSLRFLYDLSPPELSSFRHWERLRRTPCIPPLNENCKGATLSTIPKILVEGVKQNGSLHVFEGLVCGEWSPVGGTRPKSLFSPDMHRKIQAYLDRNRELPKVLSNLVDTTDESVQNNGDAVASSPHQRMVPDLLAAATMVPRMAPTHFLKGLAAVVA